MPKAYKGIKPSFQRARFARIYYLDRRLRENSYPNTPQLARMWEVHTRTIERDIEYMRDRLGAPLAYDYRRKGYYYAGEFCLPPLNLTEDEMSTLFLAQKLLAQCAGTPLEDPVRSAFEKIRLSLPQSFSLDFSSLEQSVSFNVEPLRGDETYLTGAYQSLKLAVQNRTTVWMRYFSLSRNETRERQVDPYHLRYYQGAWYLIAFCHLRQEIRIFAVDRIRELRHTGEEFEPLPGFSLQAYLEGSLGIEVGAYSQEVVILFDSHQARWIRERQWHPSQVLEPRSDGSLTLRLTVSGLGEVKRWVLSFGRHAEILSPRSLRQQIEEEIQAMVSQYSQRKKHTAQKTP
ncbi:MAG TPA: WYL domain-containing protein [Clostridia bacterium]|nr:WYL domain-containing protein [Clostridia bacterium]